MASDTHNNLTLDAILNGDSEQLLRLLASCYPAPSHESRHAISQDHLLELIKSIKPEEICSDSESRTFVEIVHSRIEPLDYIADPFYGLLVFTDKLFMTLSQLGKLDSAFHSALAGLKPYVASKLIQNPGFIFNIEHPFHIALSAIHQHAIGWQPSDGRVADKFLPKLEELIFQLANADDDSKVALIGNDIISFFNQNQTRLDKLENRLRDAEFGALRAKYAQQKTARLINQKLGGKKLPESVATFLKTHWRESLILIVIQLGTNSTQWAEAEKTTAALIDSFQPIDDDNEKRQAVFESIEGLSDKLRELTLSLSHDSDLQEQALADIEALHLDILKGGTVEYSPFDLIDNANPLNVASAKISSNLLEQVAKLKEGQWFISIDEDNKTSRMKLILKLEDIQQLLFCNQQGMKSGQFGFEEFAYRLSSRSIKPIRVTAQPRGSASTLLSKLFESHQQKLTAAAEKIEQARIKALAEAQALEKAQALTEQEEQVADNEAISNVPDTVIEEEKPLISDINVDNTSSDADYDERYKNAIEDIGKLSLQARVSITDDDGEEELCKLAVRLKSTGKYIFVDRAGMKKYEINESVLINWLVDQKACIIDHGSNFDDPLSNVVNSLRKKTL